MVAVATITSTMCEVDWGHPSKKAQHHVGNCFNIFRFPYRSKKPNALGEVQAAFKNGEFKANCSLTWISYLIALGIINAENEGNLLTISSHLHRQLDFPTKWTDLS